MAGANDRESTDIGYLEIPASVSALDEFEFDLDTTAIKEMINGTFTNNGFALITDTESNDQVTFYSTNDLPARQATLTIVYELISPQAIIF
jgi:hypothetical protein